MYVVRECFSTVVTETDCEQLNLLRKFVQKDLDRIDTSLSFDQRLAKVQWKKVADRIAREGGSYQFGNSTCKQKYREISRAR